MDKEMEATTTEEIKARANKQAARVEILSLIESKLFRERQNREYDENELVKHQRMLRDMQERITLPKDAGVLKDEEKIKDAIEFRTFKILLLEKAVKAVREG